MKAKIDDLVARRSKATDEEEISEIDGLLAECRAKVKKAKGEKKLSSKMAAVSVER